MSDDTMRNDDTQHDDDSGASLPAACAAFDAALADYLEGTLDPAARAEADAHRTRCPRCAALAADLEGIVAGARALAPIVPAAATSAAMWNGIAARIAAPAVPLEARAAQRDLARRQASRLPARVQAWRRPLAAAAALVLVTAGVTYSVTRHVLAGDGQVVARPSPAPVPPGPQTPVAPITAPTQVAAGSEAGAAGSGSSATQGAGTPGHGATAAPRTGVAGLVSRPLRPSAAATYQREIDGLRRILQERRGELDSTTVVVLERNLAVIDLAIAQSRAALARDPRSRFLGQQLNSALDKKLELLRTAALLPART